jgi:hypothetical protein
VVGAAVPYPGDWRNAIDHAEAISPPSPELP